MKESFREYYEKEAVHVSRYSCSFWDSRYHRKREKHIVSFLKCHSYVDTFLDVGCGTGEYLVEASNFSVKRLDLTSLAREERK